MRIFVLLPIIKIEGYPDGVRDKALEQVELFDARRHGSVEIEGSAEKECRREK